MILFDFISRATPSAAGPFWLLGTAIWEPWCLLFDILEASLAPRAHVGGPFWHLGSTLDAILAPRDHPGGPWMHQDGREVADDRICEDLGMISEPVSVSSWVSKCVKNFCMFGFVSRSFVIDF